MDVPSLSQEQRLSRQIRRIALWSVGLLLAISAVIFIFLPQSFTTSFNNTFGSFLAVTKKVDPFSVLGGYAYLTLATGSAHALALYELDMSTRQLRPISFSDKKARFAFGLSPDRSQALYTEVAINDGFQAPTPDNTGQVRLATLRDGNVRTLTNDTLQSKQQYEWAPGGTKAVFTSWSQDELRKEGKRSPVLPEDSNLYLLDLSKQDLQKPQLLVKGQSAAWSSLPGTFFYIANDGIHVYNMNSGVSALVFAIPGGTIRGMNLDSSQDGQYLALSSPSYHAIHIYKVSWTKNQPTIAAIRSISVDGSPWPIAFEPGNQYMAYITYQGFTTEQSGPTAINALYVYSFAAQKSVQVADLSSYVGLVPALSDWSTVSVASTTFKTSQ